MSLTTSKILEKLLFDELFIYNYKILNQQIIMTNNYKLIVYKYFNFIKHYKLGNSPVFIW